MRIALNPIQWMASADGWLDPSLASSTEHLLALVRKAGFDGVMAAVPADWTIQRYREAVAEAGLDLAPGYFVCRSDGRDGTEADVLAAAATVTRQHAELGPADIGLGLGLSKDAPRVLAIAAAHGRLLGAAPDTFLGSASQTARRALDDGLVGEAVGTTVRAEISTLGSVRATFAEEPS